MHEFCLMHDSIAELNLFLFHFVCVYILTLGWIMITYPIAKEQPLMCYFALVVGAENNLKVRNLW